MATKIETSLPKVSIITPSLNQGRFIRHMIETILNQTFHDWELVVADSNSTDETVKILKEYPKIQWISEKDNSFLEGMRKAFALSRGRYIIQCLTSDGLVSPDWIEKCVNILDADPKISLVWGHSISMSEDSCVQKVAHPEFFEDPPPQKEDFLPFWLVTTQMFAENNFCIRREVFDGCYPPIDSENVGHKINPYLAFNYNFNTRGFLPYFLPMIASHGRDHQGNRTEELYEIQAKLEKEYHHDVKNYRKNILSGAVKHTFKDGDGKPLREIGSEDLFSLRRAVLNQRVRRSRFLRMDLFSFTKKLQKKIGLLKKNVLTKI